MSQTEFDTSDVIADEAAGSPGPTAFGSVRDWELLNTMLAELYAAVAGTAAVNDSLSGSGTTQGGATQLVAGKNRATTVTASDNAFVGPSAGDFIFFNDDSADSAQVFPPSGGDYGDGTDLAVNVAAGDFAKFVQKSSTVWVLEAGTVA